ALRQKGLGERENLDENKGMYFVFDKPGYPGFWMKDMKQSIDIIWLNEDRKIVHIEEELSPSTYPQVYTPAEKSLYVLELKSGFVLRHNVKIGDQVEIISAEA